MFSEEDEAVAEFAGRRRNVEAALLSAMFADPPKSVPAVRDQGVGAHCFTTRDTRAIFQAIEGNLHLDRAQLYATVKATLQMGRMWCDDPERHYWLNLAAPADGSWTWNAEELVDLAGEAIRTFIDCDNVLLDFGPYAADCARELMRLRAAQARLEFHFNAARDILLDVGAEEWNPRAASGIRGAIRG